MNTKKQSQTEMTENGIKVGKLTQSSKKHTLGGKGLLSLSQQQCLPNL